jgi:hypothetical protein
VIFLSFCWARVPAKSGERAIMIDRRLIVLLVATVLFAVPASANATELTIMSLNVWGGGANAQKPVDETVAAIKAAGADGAFVFGNFNGPSHRDWTEAAVKAGNQAMIVTYPTVKAIEDKGFVDMFRAAYPDPAAKPGFTWTPTSDPKATGDHHDRIDFALAERPSRHDGQSKVLIVRQLTRLSLIVMPGGMTAPGSPRSPVTASQ